MASLRLFAAVALLAVGLSLAQGSDFVLRAEVDATSYYGLSGAQLDAQRINQDGWSWEFTGTDECEWGSEWQFYVCEDNDPDCTTPWLNAHPESYLPYDAQNINKYNLIPVTCCTDPVPSPSEFWTCTRLSTSLYSWQPICFGVGQCTVNGTVIILKNTNLSISDTIVVNGNLDVRGVINFQLNSNKPLFDVAACANTSQGTINVDLTGFQPSSQTVLVSGQSSCSAFSSVTFTGAPEGSCVSTSEVPDSNGRTSLVMLFAPEGQDGCGEPPVSLSGIDIPVVAGATVGGVVGAFLIVFGILMAVPATRAKILPYRARANTKLDQRDTL